MPLDKSRDVPAHVLDALFAHLDVAQAQRVQAKPHVLADALEPRVRAPVLGPERDADRLAKVVPSEAARAERSGDRRIVDDAHVDRRRRARARRLERACAHNQVRVRRRRQRVADDQERDVARVRRKQDIVRLELHRLAVRERHFFFVEFFLGKLKSVPCAL